MLDAKQRVFARCIAQGKNQAEAAREAGYSESSAKVTGSRLMRNSKVLEEIRKQRELIGIDGNLYFDDPAEFIKAVMNDVSLDAKIRLDAAKFLENRKNKRPLKNDAPQIRQRPLGKAEVRKLEAEEALKSNLFAAASVGSGSVQ